MARDELDLGSWAILRMGSADTLRVVKALSDSGFNVWTPIESKASRMPRTRARYEKDVPIMPSYAFAHVDGLDALLRLAMIPRRDIPRFTVFHHQGGIPLIADWSLSPLREEEDRKARIFEKAKRKGIRAPVFAKGYEVTISEGSFAGLSGVVEDSRGQFTLVSFEGYHTPIQIASILLGGSDANEVGLAA